MDSRAARNKAPYAPGAFASARWLSTSTLLCTLKLMGALKRILHSRSSNGYCSSSLVHEHSQELHSSKGAFVALTKPACRDFEVPIYPVFLVDGYGSLHAYRDITDRLTPVSSKATFHRRIKSDTCNHVMYVHHHLKLGIFDLPIPHWP